jgi:hypothetical protein
VAHAVVRLVDVDFADADRSLSRWAASRCRSSRTLRCRALQLVLQWVTNHPDHGRPWPDSTAQRADGAAPHWRPLVVGASTSGHCSSSHGTLHGTTGAGYRVHAVCANGPPELGPNGHARGVVTARMEAARSGRRQTRHALPHGVACLDAAKYNMVTCSATLLPRQCGDVRVVEDGLGVRVVVPAD